METDKIHVHMPSNIQELTLHPLHPAAEEEGRAIGTSELVCSIPFDHRFILIEGPMGYGKSVLLRHLSEKLQPHCSSVYLNLESPEFHGSKTGLKECIRRQKTTTKGSKHLLYLFDSFDVLLLKCSWGLDAFTSFVKEECLQNGTVLVATRPSGVSLLYRECKVDRHYSIDGFSMACVHSQVNKGEYAKLASLLKHHEVLMKMCQIPMIFTLLVDTIKRKKFLTYSKLTLTDIVHEVVLGILKIEISKTRGETVHASNLHSLEAKDFDFICILAFLDLLHGSELESLQSFSYFLSSIFLKYGVSSLNEVEDLGLLYHCEQDSYYATFKKKLYWFLSPEIRDFLAAFMLHLWPALDQLQFLSEHAQNLLKVSGKSGYSGWLQFFFGLTVQREAEYNSARMMFSSLNELLANSLDLKNSIQLMIFIKCISEAHEPSLWRKLATRNSHLFDMTLTADEVQQIEACIVDLVNSSGFKEWHVSVSSDRLEVVDSLAAKVRGKVAIRITIEKSLTNEVKLWPKITTATSSTSQSSVDLFYCRAIRELLQRVLQVYTPWKLKGDCSTTSYVSFLSCKCFQEAIEDRISFEPIIATHFLTLEAASKKAGKGESDPVMRHIREVHNDEAVELVILLHPVIKKLTFQLPINEGVSTDIQLCGDYSRDNDYARFVAFYVEGFEEVVQCIVSHDASVKTESAYPCLPLSKEFKNGTVAPQISLPPSIKKHSSKAEAEEMVKAPTTHPATDESNYHYALQVESESEPFSGVVSITSKALFSDGKPTTQPIQQQQKISQQSSRRLTNVKPGTVLFTSEPFHVPLDMVIPLFDQNPLIQVGGNGQIFAGTINGIEFAVKKTPYRSKEYAVITKVQHRNVIPLVAFIWGEENPTHRRRYFCYHVMPRMSGDLARMVTDKPDLTLTNLHLTHSSQISVVTFNIRHILSSVLEALAYLHSIHIAHRDIKPSNILVKFSDCECDVPLLCSCQTKFDVCLCDFDAALQLDADDCMQPVIFSSSQTMLALAPQYHSVPVGTSGYRAPECSMHTTTNYPDSFSPPISCRCDVFSLGVLCVRLMVGDEGPHRQRVMALLLLHYHHEKGCVEGRWRQKVPIVTVEDILKISKIRREMQWLGHVTDFVESCLKVDPLSRPSATQLLLHPFLMNTD